MSVTTAAAEPWGCGVMPTLLWCTPSTIGKVTGALAKSVVDDVATSFANASVEMLKTLLTLWIKAPKPGLQDSSPSDPLYFVRERTGWLVTWIAVLGLLIAAGKMAWQRRGEPFRDLMSGVVTMIVLVAVTTTALRMAIEAGHDYSVWIIEAAGDGDTKGALGKVAALYSAGMLPAMPGVVLIVALLAILSSVVQFAMMLVRGAMLVLLAGTLPLAAAAGLHPDGREMRRKAVGWTIAFVAYEPTAATIYAIVIRGLKGNSVDQLQAAILAIMAVAALPALMRFINPVVSAASGGGSGALAGAVAGGAAAGARMVPSFGSGKGGGGSAGGSGGGDASGPEGAQNPGPPARQPPTDGGDGEPGPTGGVSPDGAPSNGGMTPTDVPVAEGSEAVGTASTTATTGVSAAAGPIGAGAMAFKEGVDGAKQAAQGAAQDATGEAPDGSR